MKIGKIVRFEKKVGDPVQAGSLTLTPQTWTLEVYFPNGGYVWNQPAAIVVETGDHREAIPIHDVTRTAQAALYGAAVIFAILGWLVARKE